MSKLTIKVQSEAFDAGSLFNQISGSETTSGAVASFLGQVRGSDTLIALELEHYPGVTEKALTKIAGYAASHWSLAHAMIIHRVGRMEINDPIVFVGASAPHRRAALDAVSYMIDVLKTQAPFWKKEHTSSGTHWIEPRAEDDAASTRWLTMKEEIK